MSYFTQIGFSDTGSLDAFSRLRISIPETLFEVQNQYNSSSLQMESSATGTGVVPTFSTDTRMTQLQTLSGIGTSYTQSYQYTPYEPGKSQFIATTFVIGTGVANTTIDVGYFDASNGVIFRQNGATDLQAILRTSTSGTVSDTLTVSQSAWNIDKLDGTGSSGITLDVTKAQILIIDLQFLGMGRVRMGFDIDGVVYYIHEFKNANNLAIPYMQTASLPVQMLVTAASSSATKSSHFKCATVQSEGGAIRDFGFSISTPDVQGTAGSGTRAPIIAVRPALTFNGITNREVFILDGIELVVTGANPVYWELVLGGTYTGQTFIAINSAYSAFEYSSVPGSYSNLTGGVVIKSGYASDSSPGNLFPVSVKLENPLKYPITLNRSGALRPLGILTLLATGIGGTSACRASINFREIR